MNGKSTAPPSKTRCQPLVTLKPMSLVAPMLDRRRKATKQAATTSKWPRPSLSVRPVPVPGLPDCSVAVPVPPARPASGTLGVFVSWRLTGLLLRSRAGMRAGGRAWSSPRAATTETGTAMPGQPIARRPSKSLAQSRRPSRADDSEPGYPEPSVSGRPTPPSAARIRTHPALQRSHAPGPRQNPIRSTGVSSAGLTAWVTGSSSPSRYPTL